MENKSCFYKRFAKILSWGCPALRWRLKQNKTKYVWSCGSEERTRCAKKMERL